MVVSDSKRAVALSEVSPQLHNRIETRVPGIDLVTGGGIVRGSLLLLGGDPGTGKSTLLMQISSIIEQQGGKVLYVSGEESVSQVKLRAERLRINSGHIYLADDSDISAIQENIEQIKPDLLIIDSVQTMTSEGNSNAMGGVNQIKDAVHNLMKIAKGQGQTTIVVGQVTKEGTIAGPRMLEHMVDVVLYLKGDREDKKRQLVALKNRFGSTDNKGNFEMGNLGLMDRTYSISKGPRKKKGPVRKVFSILFWAWVSGIILYNILG